MESAAMLVIRKTAEGSWVIVDTATKLVVFGPASHSECAEYLTR